MPTPSTPERQAARAAGLRYVDDTQPGISRRRAGKGFSYRDADGHAIRDATTLQRIRALAIPPAYTAVWICAHANGHLQATGRDARGRKQYRYHPDWARERDAGKFDRIIALARHCLLCGGGCRGISSAPVPEGEGAGHGGRTVGGHAGAGRQ